MALEENNDQNAHLAELGGSDYEIADGEPDIKGWDVKNEHGQKIGEVDELLFDPQSRKVRYVIVDLDDNELELEQDKMILVPIGVVSLYDSITEDEDHVDLNPENEPEAVAGTAEERPVSTVVTSEEEYDEDGSSYNPAYDSEVVIVPATIMQLRELPAYRKERFNTETEIATRQVFDPTALAPVLFDRDEFYNHRHFSEQGYYDRPAKS